jgi:muramoyltetrapeptide carboxypeptidase
VLDRLPWGALESAKPKWVLGYSDTSTWMLPLTLRLGWATAHGPCLMDLVPGQDDPLTRGALPMLARAAGESATQSASTHWQAKWRDFAKEPACVYALTEPTRWRCLNRDEHEPITFSGRLIGGCFDTLLALAGSAYGDVPGFVRRHAAEGSVLYLENAELSPMALVRGFTALRWAGWFEGLAGVLLGRSAAPDSKGATQLRYGEAIERCWGALPCPVLVDVDIGHKPPQMTLVNGALATVHFGGSGSASAGLIEQRFV